MRAVIDLFGINNIIVISIHERDSKYSVIKIPSFLIFTEVLKSEIKYIH